MPYVLQGLFALLGRILLCSVFLMGAVGMVMHFDDTAGRMTGRGMPAAPVSQVLLAGAIAFLAAGSASVILGFKARFGALLLLIFLAAVTPIFHNFWALEGPEQQQEMG